MSKRTALFVIGSILIVLGVVAITGWPIVGLVLVALGMLLIGELYLLPAGKELSWSVTLGILVLGTIASLTISIFLK